MEKELKDIIFTITDQADQLGYIHAKLDVLRDLIMKAEKDDAETSAKYGHGDVGRYGTIRTNEIRDLFKWPMEEEIVKKYDEAEKAVTERKRKDKEETEAREEEKKEEPETDDRTLDEKRKDAAKSIEEQCKEAAKRIAGVAAKKGGRKKVDREAVREMHDESGMSAKQISELMGIGYSTVCAILREEKNEED